MGDHGGLPIYFFGRSLMIAMAIVLGGVIFSSLPPGFKLFAILVFVVIATKTRE